MKDKNKSEKNSRGGKPAAAARKKAGNPPSARTGSKKRGKKAAALLKLTVFLLFLLAVVFVAAGLTWHRKRPVFAWIIAVLYACTDEVHQMFVPGRACRLFDLAVDAAGAVAGIFFCILVLRISHRLTGRNRKCGEKRLK